MNSFWVIYKALSSKQATLTHLPLLLFRISSSRKLTYLEGPYRKLTANPGLPDDGVALVVPSGSKSFPDAEMETWRGGRHVS